jgi:hypothetical protein
VPVSDVEANPSSNATKRLQQKQKPGKPGFFNA